MKISPKIIFIIFFFFITITQKLYAAEKIKIGLLVPLSGKDNKIGKSILQSVRLAINKINNSDIEVIPKDTMNDPLQTKLAANELQMSVNVYFQDLVMKLLNKNPLSRHQTPLELLEELKRIGNYANLNY